MVFPDVMSFGSGCDICLPVYYYLTLISKHAPLISRLIYIEENRDKNADARACSFVEIISYNFC